MVLGRRAPYYITPIRIAFSKYLLSSLQRYTDSEFAKYMINSCSIRSPCVSKYSLHCKLFWDVSVMQRLLSNGFVNRNVQITCDFYIMLIITTCIISHDPPTPSTYLTAFPVIGCRLQNGFQFYDYHNDAYVIAGNKAIPNPCIRRITKESS